jgi:formate dehydrogenase major subunit
MSLIRKNPVNTTTRSVPVSNLIGSLSRGLKAAVPTMDRRTFLKRSGIGVGAGIAVSQLNLVQKATAADPSKAMLDGKGKIEVKRTVCTHCSVGCASDATVENGVWFRHDPVFESPLNMGGQCA